jgi:hypothetical protein
MKTKKAAFSVVLAAATLSIAVLATGNEATQAGRTQSPQAEPTPYSADHSRIEYRPGAFTEMPSTF